ncbi:MAG: putative porin [Bacteroidales bacterium]
MKRIDIILILLLFNFPFLAHTQEEPSLDTATSYITEIETWKIDQFYNDTSFVLDTNWYSLHQFNPTYGKLYLSSFGSPVKKPYIDLNRDDRFIFSSHYKDYFYNRKNTIFYKTTTPFTYFNYNSGGGSDQIAKVKAFHTQNVNQFLNFAFRIKINSSTRFYEPDDEKTVRANFLSFSLSYNTNSYTAYMDINSNSVTGKEIGGIQDQEEFESGLYEIFTPRISDAQSVLKSKEFNLTQKINLLDKFASFFTREDISGVSTDTTYDDQDSIETDSIVNPNNEKTDPQDSTRQVETGIIHDLSYENNKYKYMDSNPLSLFYEDFPVYIDSVRTNDHSRMNVLSNDLMLYFETGNFNFIGGVGHEHVKHESLARMTPDDTLTGQTVKKYHKYDNVNIFTRLNKQVFKKLEFEGEAKSYLAGFKSGDLSGRAGLNFKFDSTLLKIGAQYILEEPLYYYQHYNSNHFQWNNNFSKSNSILLNMNYANWKYDFNVDINSGLLNNYVFLNTNAEPEQYPNDLHYLKISLDKTFSLNNFFFENKIYYQYSSDDKVFTYPEWYLYESLSWRYTFHFGITGGKLSTQIGVNMYYFPEFYADAYMPALNLFYNQGNQKIGGKPIFNAFINLKVKRTSAFLKLSHVNSPLQERDYYSAPDYPMSPLMFKFGVFWSFYD